MALLSGPGSGTLTRAQLEHQPGLQPSGGSTGTVGTASKMAPSHGCWQEDLVFHSQEAA